VLPASVNDFSNTQTLNPPDALASLLKSKSMSVSRPFASPCTENAFHPVAMPDTLEKSKLSCPDKPAASDRLVNRTRDEQWTLSPTGNFSRRKIDLNGDGSFNGTDEIDDTSTFNKANEWLTRDTDSNGSTNYTLTHDAVGQLTDDGKDYKYKYDGFGRLKEVRNQSNNLVAEYRYNGLGYRIGWHYDSNASGAVDGSDPWYYFVYDERWRPVATYRGSDTNPKELFVFNAAGKGGMGGSSYIDSVVLRDKDGNTAWTSAADGTLEDRIYYCQNWRNDVSVLVKPDSGNGLEIVEWIKYSAYGVPYCIAAADYNRSGGNRHRRQYGLRHGLQQHQPEGRRELRRHGRPGGLVRVLQRPCLGRERWAQRGVSGGGWESDWVCRVSVGCDARELP
jgi:YD repeat-containing protein